jgi:hypothetical protein
MLVKPIRGTRYRTIFDGMDPATMDIMCDPLYSEEIERVAILAEHPELADFWFMSIPGIELILQRSILSGQRLTLRRSIPSACN